ncbi:hypothetical protein F4809DRAFT_594948 [Biscogniauxia mediterranea]|nr:hypothetical protein F4809DRAFT_594948 [Biscogniauxia mediterranea]
MFFYCCCVVLSAIPRCKTDHRCSACQCYIYSNLTYCPCFNIHPIDTRSFHFCPTHEKGEKKKLFPARSVIAIPSVCYPCYGRTKAVRHPHYTTLSLQSYLSYLGIPISIPIHPYIYTYVHTSEEHEIPFSRGNMQSTSHLPEQ